MSISGSVRVEHGGAELHLLPQRAVWWPATCTVVVADVHLGKGTAFRTMGVPVPTGGSAKDLARLGELLTATKAERLLIVGDLVHARRSHQPQLSEAMRQWRAAFEQVAVCLVRGNHDRSAGRLAGELGIEEVDDVLTVDGIELRHHPQPAPDGHATLAGHVHPVVAVQDFDRSAVRLPCFVFGPAGMGILPSFGTFTGWALVERVEGRTCYACTPSRVVRVPATGSGWT